MSIRQVVWLLFMVCLLINLGTITINAEEIIYEVKFSLDDVSFGTQNGYDTVTLPDCIATMEPGKPQLPLKVLHFAIDQDKNISDIELIADTTEEINGQYYIYPAQKPTRMDQEPTFTPPDSSVYNSYQSYPESRIEIKAKGSLSGTKIVTVHVYPLEYIPIEKKLILHTVMKLKVVQKNKSSSSASIQTETTTLTPSIAKRSNKGNDTIKSMLKKVIANPEYIDGQFKQPVKLQSLDVGIPKSSGNGIDYLIITSEDLKNSGVFQPLIDSKVARGLSVAVETIEDIENYPGRDTPEKIRNCIKDKWVNNGLVWVLLGGDTNIVPVRMVAMCENPPCDMYYSDLDGDWDANGNDLFGEEDDNVDFYPDVFVGRAPVEDEIEAQVFVNKIFTYEANIHYYANKALFLGLEFGDDIGGDSNDLIEAEYMPVEFYPITKYYQRDIPAYSQLTIDAMNRGYHLINHIDHASLDCLATGRDHIFTDDIDSLTNALSPAILCSSGCHAAAIDYDCIAEHWINNPNGGGVAFVGNTRSGLFVYSEYLQEEFYKSLFVESFTHIGETLADSKITFIGQVQEGHQDLRFCIFTLNLLGDPEMNIWTDMSLLPHISFPSMNSFIQGEVDIEGSVVCDEMNFAGYELYYSPKDDAEDTTMITFSSEVPVENELGVWNTDIVECLDGEYILTLKVIDINDREFTYSVGVTTDNYNQVPEFINLTNKGAVIGRDLEFKVEVHDPDDPQTSWGDLTYSVYNLPPGAIFDPETQIFSWTPTEEDKGNYEVTFTVSDNEYTTTQKVLITTVVIEETPICTAFSDQREPSIYEDKIVWKDERSGDDDFDIYMYDLTTGEETPICTDPYTQWFPSIYGNKIVWMDNRNSGEDVGVIKPGSGNWDIYVYDITTGEEIPITAPGYQGHPAIYGDKIVWEGRNETENPKIYMYDITTGEETPINPNSYGYCEFPVIYEDKIVWDESRGLNFDIYMYSLSVDTDGDGVPNYLDSDRPNPDPAEIQITTDPQSDSSPSIYEDKIVFVWHIGNIRMYDVTKEEEIPITIEYYYKYNPVIYEDKIVWQDGRRNKYRGDIYMYDLCTNSEIRVTTSLDGTENLPDIYEDKVVWQDNRSGDGDIYMATVIFAPQIISVSPIEVSAGNVLTITGKNLGYGRDDSTVEFENGAVCPVISWSNTEITCTVPQDAVTGLLKVITRGGESEGIIVTVTEHPASCWDCPSQCHGDADGDGWVNNVDFCILRDAWGKDYWNDWNDGLGPYNPCGDFNRDGYVDLGDFYIFKDNYYKQVSSDCELGGIWPPVREQDEIIATVTVGDYPLALAVSPDGNYLYVTNLENSVSVIQTSDNTVVETISVSGSHKGIAITPDGNYLYVTSTESDNASVIRTSDNTVVATISVGDYPHGVAVTPDGSYVYVANYSDNSVSVIRTSDNTVVDTISVGTNPMDVAVTPDGNYAYVTNVNDGTVSVIRTSDNTVIDTISTAGSYPWGITITPDGKYVYVIDACSDIVSVIQTSDNTVVTTVTLGVSTSSWNLAVTPDGNYVYVVSGGGGGTVSVIRTSDNKVVNSISVGLGDNPYDIAITPDGKYVYVTNVNEGTVSVIERTTESITTQFIDSGIEFPGVRSSTLSWGDYNNDGYLDFAIGGNFSSGLDEDEGQGKIMARIYKNNGDDTFTDIEAGLFGFGMGSFAWGDCDNDGDLDLAVCGDSDGNYLTKIYRNSGNNIFTDINAGITGIDEGSLAWGDYDNDGDLDLAISGSSVEKGHITTIYRNDRIDGNNIFTDINLGLIGISEVSLALGDYDNDSDLDLAVCGHYDPTYSGITRIYKNNGDDIFTDIFAGVIDIEIGSLAWGDYDNDGDLDLAICGYSSEGYISRIYKNNGDDTFTDIEAELTGVGASSLAWGDYDNDGYLDLAVCGDTINYDECITKIYKNNGDDTFTDINAELTGVWSGDLAWGDYDNDGDLDLVICGIVTGGAPYEMITKIYKNLEADAVGNNNPNTSAFAPTDLISEIVGDNVFLKWYSGSDIETSETGLYYNVRIGTTTGANDIVSGVYGSPLLGNYLRPKLSSDQLGVRLNNLPDGTYYWSVQTIDTGLKTSPWSEENTFIILPSISGKVTLEGGSSSVEEVVLSLSGALSEDTNPDTAGNYSFTGLEKGLYIVTPSLTDYHFFPSSRSYPLLESDQTSQNFTGLHKDYDSDQDGLPDWWELENFDNLDQGPDDDPDGDFYTNLEEYTHGTDPNDPESNPSVVWYVDDDAADIGTGTSWNNAFKYLQDALTNQQLHVGDEIWVGQGTYKPDEGSGITDNDRNAYFRLVSGVAVKGGYAGIGAPTPNERDIAHYQTILNGDIDDDGTLNNNSYTVVKGPYVESNSDPVLDTVIDGFTIMAGNSEQSDCGGGMTNYHGYFNGLIIVKNCIFKENYSAFAGGGIRNLISALKIVNCFFVNNSSVYGAGGILNMNSPLEVTNCVFSGNSVSYNGEEAWIGRGGAIEINSPTFSSKIVNCTFYGNSAKVGGGIVVFSHEDTIITNCIFWNNGEEIHSSGPGREPIVTYCDVEGGYTGVGNIDSDPLFIDTDNIAGADGLLRTSDDGLQLNVNSLCIDIADDSEASDSDILDIGRINVPDIGFAIADMGAYESVWPYKKTITITGSSVDLVDYQVKINIAYEPEMQPDFADLRFVDQGDTMLDYWLERYDEYETAVVWVKVPSIPTIGTTIDMYYGNPEAESLSNGDNTFIFFDDFSGINGNDIDTAKWGWINQSNNRATYSNSYARSGETCLKVVSSLDTGGQPYHRFDLPMSNAELTAWVYDGGYNTTQEAMVGENYFRNVGIKSLGSYYYRYRIVDSPTYYYDTTILRTVGWHKMQMRCDGIDTTFYIDDIPVATIPGLESFGQIFVGNSHTSPTTDYFDDVSVRRYSSPEPVATVEE